NYLLGNLPGYKGLNQPKWILDRWQKPGDITNIQQFSSNYSGSAGNGNFWSGFSEAVFSDASFFRLKNLSLTWNIRQSWQQKLHLEGVSLFIQTQNVWTITNYKGLDPETTSSTTLPTLSVITTGINIKL
ncbi:MAG: SusC/RagA family TonB-linked outer membrane protein, partial [Flavisolibacter sp.]|nr:SusC/RagA family TonB-linked outer membrane protein [Flavisolibacter sp.]